MYMLSVVSVVSPCMYMLSVVFPHDIYVPAVSGFSTYVPAVSSVSGFPTYVPAVSSFPTYVPAVRSFPTYVHAVGSIIQKHTLTCQLHSGISGQTFVMRLLLVTESQGDWGFLTQHFALVQHMTVYWLNSSWSPLLTKALCCPRMLVHCSMGSRRAWKQIKSHNINIQVKTPVGQMYVNMNATLLTICRTFSWDIGCNTTGI